MLCYRCGSHVPDTSETCATCGQKFDAAARQAAGAARRKGAEGAPYKPGDVVADRYAIQEVVGAGPLGFVFRAQDQAIDVEVALKVIQPRLVQQPEERTQFALSMRVGKKLNHPNLVRVYEEGVDGDRPFFTMQLLEGLSLRRMMEQRAAKGQLFSLKEVEPLLAQMAAALDGAHRFGPHSDVKPENVFVLPDMLKVSDYGLGLAVPHLPFVQAQKGHRAAAYIAPEYVNGAELDTRMDVYSLGVLMGEMVTGLLPEDGGVPEVSVRHPDLPPAFESLYRRALNVNPLARPKSGGELHAEFAALVHRHPAAASRQRSVPATGALPPAAVAARAANKPLPPVPTGMLPVALAPTPAAPLPAVDDAPPPDATQPLDAATLAAILGSNAQALDYITGPEARSVSDAATQQEMRAVAPSGRKGAEAPRPLGQAPDAATQQEARAASRPADDPRAAPAKAAEPVMRIFAKAEEPSFPADPRGARSAESAAEARSSARGGGEASSSDGRSNGRGEAAVGEGRSGRGEASSGDLRSSSRGEASGDGRSSRGEASSGDLRSSGRGEASSEGRSGRGESSSGDLRSNGRGEAASGDARSGGRGETSSDGRSNGRGEAALGDERSGRGEASSGGRSGRGGEASSDSRPSHRNADASATESRSGRSSDDDEPSESRSSSRGGRNSRASGAVSSVNSRGSEPSGPRAPRASAAQGSARASGVHGENSTGGRSRKGEPPPEVSGVRSSARRLPPSTSGLHTLPTTRATQAKPARSGPSSMMWMIILAVAGVVLGAGGGYLYLRLAQAAKNSTTPATPGTAAARDGILATGSCPAGMRLVSGGSFKMGSSPEDLQSAGSTDEMPMGSVTVNSFCVDEYEFPNQAGRKPRVSATWLDAKAACEGLGKRLCSEEEWEKACKGPGNARFSSGNEQVQPACNTGTTDAAAAPTLAPSGALQSCRSGYGVADLSGNVAEWTSSKFPNSNPEELLIKGGSFDTAGDTARCSARRRGTPSLKAANVGFRCCQDAP
ncbi:protein kinase [Corallococcus sp. CA054B]|uniref:protein kinase domain-containing protein n=1 Tax=Corallococcus sp. CA054B TaxID=2316734 RepID=UPI000EA2ADE6|nr:SUMF1/EgtB/PvdO family nonheme iron enzyme [Corallococcus sp. CA054B]RKG63212.1 protein kinase [Corallococcus sp. CA054B]